MSVKKIILSFLLLFCAGKPCHADSVSVRISKSQHWALVPILISNAETGVQLGALVMRFLNPDDTLNKPSTVGFAARVSQKKQVDVDLFSGMVFAKQPVSHHRRSRFCPLARGLLRTRQ